MFASFFIQWARGLWRKGMDFLLPPLCLVCDAPVGEPNGLCAACWKSIRFIERPFCEKCGGPFDLPVEEGTLCSACLAEAPVYTAARSAILYDEASKPLVLRFKHADRIHAAPALARWMAQAGAAFWPAADVIAPVPLHRWRLLKRRYNQSALLALAIGKEVKKPVAVDLLIRRRATDSQGHRNKKERRENVVGAFVLKKGADVAGKNVVLVDDVLTSGATVSECARVLLKAGAAGVYVLTLARVKAAD